MENKREFFIDTPLGRLKVWAKHDKDTPEDFPGVYIDLLSDGENGNDYGELLCCVEFESMHKCLQTVVYDPDVDDPVIVHRHELEETDA